MKDIFEDLSDRELELLNIIHKKDMITKKGLQSLIAMPLTTLNRAMKSLIDKKLIVEIGVSESTGGRRAVEYSTTQKGIYVVGVDISRTYVSIVIMNLKMTVLAKEKFYMDESFSPQKTVKKIVNLIIKRLKELSIDKSEVIGIGVGTVGPLNRKKGIMVKPKNFFNESWKDVNLKDMVEKDTSISCFIDNGANTAALAEYLFGSGKSFKSIVYIHCGVGIRSAVITDGIVIRTINDSEDAFAHMIVDLNGEKCTCGSKGCIESYSSIKAIIKRFNLKSSIEKIKEEDYNALLNLKVKECDLAKEVINKGAKTLGIGLSNLIKLLNPELVILCGPLINNYKFYYDICIDTFNKNNYLNNKVVFSKGGEFKEDAIAIGAALMVIENYFKRSSY
ncbi:ROK family transcriptional regulator [Clostridium felsineum]|uniref:ROK family transcriptional regulator n=1 Tax=Clostridium felsineum TaxID=36839 RepID=UPI00098C7F5B|nr:ROK family transcriptional regulator [Clostridium felsineum]MCR3759741.1 ROK family transcriptional regulator [Clostridium felsineum]URZ15672.1 N-acetylglucosamine repressor [Clostridium felsineum DSM 794]